MATYLYRLGRCSHDKRKIVLAFWLIVLVTLGTLAATMGGTKNNKFEVPGTESQQAQELLEQRYPAASGSYARVVFGRRVPGPADVGAGRNGVARQACLVDAA